MDNINKQIEDMLALMKDIEAKVETLKNCANCKYHEFHSFYGCIETECNMGRGINRDMTACERWERE